MRAGFDLITIGINAGKGLTLGSFDTMDSAATIIVNDTGKTTISGIPAVLFLTNNSATTLTVKSGSVGLSVYAEQTSVAGAVELISGSLVINNATLTTLKSAVDSSLSVLNTTVSGLISIG
jgi:hypothetical protein